MKRAGPKGVRAQSARAVTGRRCPTVGRGKTFRRVEKSLPMREMNGLSEGYKWAVDQNCGSMAKIGFFGQKPRFQAQKKHTLLEVHHVLATPGKSCSKKKVAFAQIIITKNIILGDFLG